VADPIVELTNITYKNDAGGTVFKNLNLTLPVGRSAIITGSAGSGKTTLADLLVGRRFADSGTVKLFGKEMRKRKKRLIRQVRQKIGGVGGRFDLLPLLTVADNITLPLIITCARSKLRKERLRRALTEFSLLNQAALYPRFLTRVENMMVQLARATVANQPLIIIDEPLAGLDVKTYQRVLDYFIKVALSGRSMILLTAEPPQVTIPETDSFEIANGALL